MGSRLRSPDRDKIGHVEKPYGRGLHLVWLCAAALCLLTGCWDRLEIEQRAMVLGLAVDEASPEEVRRLGSSAHLNRPPQSTNIFPLRLTAQIAVPGRIPLGPGGDPGGGSGGGSEGGEQQPVWVLHSVGYTLEDAVSNLQQQVADPLFFGHLRILVISEAIARKGVTDINDWLRRNAEIRRTLWMTVATGNAAAVLEAAPPLERVPTLYLWATFTQAQQLGKLPVAYGNVFWRAYSCKGQEPYMPYVEIRQRNNIFIRGLAYFKGNRMIGSLSSLDVGLYMVVKGINPGGYSVSVQVPGQDQDVLVQSLHRKSRIEVYWAQDRPGIKVRAHMEGMIREKPGNHLDLRSPQQIRMLEDEIARSLKRDVEQLIKRTQRDGADIFGFGEYVRARMYDYWKRTVRTKADWESLYPTIPVQVEVTANIRRVGTLDQ